jgi:hypothetical protein
MTTSSRQGGRVVAPPRDQTLVRFTASTTAVLRHHRPLLHHGALQTKSRSNPNLRQRSSSHEGGRRVTPPRDQTRVRFATSTTTTTALCHHPRLQPLASSPPRRPPIQILLQSKSPTTLLFMRGWSRLRATRRRWGKKIMKCYYTFAVVRYVIFFLNATKTWSNLLWFLY